MPIKTWLLLAGVALAGQGCAPWSGTPQERQILTVPLAATIHNAGKIAQATLVAEGERTGISFIIGGVPDGTSRPVHLYTFIYPGRCDRLGPAPAWEMNQIVLADRLGRAQAGWRLSKRVEVPLEQLRNGGYSLLVRNSPADGNWDLFCGEIE
ncbi:hypothetical protein SAMN05216229_10145 [Geopseudomonas sagittaria]|uniref:Lipoprotein n=1 Tax=Geopseudomonas sagittaria TaxID=1135990 RepID=A0A1I5NJZ2_9GAMM|nr:hypothetical protein [Pseudomonas sagittaria]MCM2331119.1 hypothetical protein [Pseudomonas sagittaria]SFP22128.1 hypothetical protein SAMN05216229_10145 [Pseudomonas sagittaria]